MDVYAAPLKFGAPLRFQDAWRGTLNGIEVTEDWEAVNLLLQKGAAFWKQTVKLPFTAAETWSDDQVALNCMATQAFAREIAPLAVPARPLTPGTPVATAGVALAGVLVRPSDRHVTTVLLRHGFREYRADLSQLAFEGKTMTLAQQLDNLPAYKSDDQLREDVWQALLDDRGLSGDDRREMAIEVAGGGVRLDGNVRTKYAREYAERAAAAVPGVLSLQNHIVDDLQLEQATGQALEEAGLQRRMEVYVRSSLGEVSLWGAAPSQALIEEAVRTVVSVGGVRGVKSHIELRPVAAVSAPSSDHGTAPAPVTPAQPPA